MIGDKLNKYTMWLTRETSRLDPEGGVNMPVKYEMRGFNTLLGSHYDHYYLTFEDFAAVTPDPRVFDDYKRLYRLSIQ